MNNSPDIGDREIEEILKEARKRKNLEKENPIVHILKKAISSTLDYYGKGDPTQPGLNLARADHRNMITNKAIKVFNTIFAHSNKGRIIVIDNPQSFRRKMEEALGRICHEFYAEGHQKSNLLSPTLKRKLAKKVMDILKDTI